VIVVTADIVSDRNIVRVKKNGQCATLRYCFFLEILQQAASEQACGFDIMTSPQACRSGITRPV
jgi:hypothetical protein